MAIKHVETRVLLLSIVALLPLEGLAAILAGKAPFPISGLGALRILETLAILLIVSFWGQGVASMGLAPDQVMGGIKKGAIWSVVFGLVVFLVSLVLYAAHISPFAFIKTPLPKAAEALVWFFIVGGLVVPVAEEVFFRGVIYGFLRRWGVLVAVAGTTTIFVASHSIISRVPVTQIVGGIVFALAYETGGSLMVPITIHVLGNTAIFALSLVLA